MVYRLEFPRASRLVIATVRRVRGFCLRGNATAKLSFQQGNEISYLRFLVDIDFLRWHIALSFMQNQSDQGP